MEQVQSTPDVHNLTDMSFKSGSLIGVEERAKTKTNTGVLRCAQNDEVYAAKENTELIHCVQDDGEVPPDLE
jgi:hypothetical protein